ncbi:MAG: serine protease [Burkholderiales bacterium]|nr:serine protease [Burkholderiales bacterium]
MKSLLCALALLGMVMATPPAASAPAAGTPGAAGAPPDGERAVRAVLAALDAVVQVRVRAVADARSLRTLGRDREGSGVVLADSGLVLTIGYLILEADQIILTDGTGKSIPASVAAYDHATGFGLLRPTVPLAVKGAPLGDSAAVTEAEPLIFAVHGGKEQASLASVVSKRRFAGYWEYMIDGAIFTAPPRGDHSGAALIDRRGTVVGIGSLIVADAAAAGQRLPGNMFVPVDLAKPLIAALAARGSAPEVARPWLGVSTQEVNGRLLVIRVQEDSPAAAAGLDNGDVILGIGGASVATLEEFYRRLWAAGPPGTEIRLQVQRAGQARDLTVRSIDRNQHMRSKPSL